VQSATYFTADLDDALALVADFDDAVALERKEATTYFKNTANMNSSALASASTSILTSTPWDTHYAIPRGKPLWNKCYAVPHGKPATCDF
jgi:hypothetical protein